MKKYRSIEEKITELGGIKDNPACKNTKNKISFNEVESVIKYKIPNSFKKFSAKYGAFSFIKTVKFHCENYKTTNENNYLSVDYFYDSSTDNRCSILKLILKYDDQLPKGYLPICDGDNGDLICINLNSDDYGSIYYWSHDEISGNDLLKISSNFEEFIYSLEVYKQGNDQDINIDNIKVNTSPKILEMLKKSGYKPKNN